MFSSNSDEWTTPIDFFKELDNEFHFTLDPCATHENHLCDTYFTIEEDGLKQDWSGHRVFMNPPYSKPENPCKPNCKKKKCQERGYHLDTYKAGQEDWIRKAYEESKKGALVVALIPARTDTNAFHSYIWDKNKHHPREGVEIRFIEGRLKFGGCDDPAPFPSMVVIFRTNKQ